MVITHLKRSKTDIRRYRKSKKIDQSIMIPNYMQVKEDILNIVEFKMEKLVEDPASRHLVIKNNMTV